MHVRARKNTQRGLRQLVANFGPISAACAVVLIALGLDIFQLGIAKVGGESLAFVVANTLKIVIAFYVARCLGVVVGVHERYDRNGSARALALVAILFPLLMLGDIVRLFVSVAETKSFDCFPLRRSGFEELRVAFVAPVAEELMFTGFLFATSRKLFHDLFATAFVALVFSLMHLPENFDLFLTRFVFMAGSCVLLMKTSVLWPSILLHMAGNVSLLLLARMDALCEELQSLYFPSFLNSPSLALAMLLFFAWLAKKRARQPP
ncbi:MAG: CPBP family intramembrane glutamic endopeptidase [Caldimonas sp.]